MGDKNLFVFSIVSARGNPHRPRLSQLRAQTQCRCSQTLVDNNIKLDTAGDRYTLGRGANGAETARIISALCGNPGQLRHHRVHQPGDTPVAPRRALRQPRIHQHHRNTALFGEPDHVRPQLRFHDHQCRRAHPIQEARHGTRCIVGGVGVLHAVAKQSARARGTGGGHRRHQNPAAGVTLQQRVH